MRVYLHVLLYICSFDKMYIYIILYTFVCISVCMSMFVCNFVCTHVCVYVCTRCDIYGCECVSQDKSSAGFNITNGADDFLDAIFRSKGLRHN